ncbi:MAG TPA: hypothetical protein VNG90_05760 [Candidatus Acidoferrum sp.]|nr:hypothetical protein [Candidatus Acidoferrum sp.]
MWHLDCEPVSLALLYSIIAALSATTVGLSFTLVIVVRYYRHKLSSFASSTAATPAATPARPTSVAPAGQLTPMWPFVKPLGELPKPFELGAPKIAPSIMIPAIPTQPAPIVAIPAARAAIPQYPPRPATPSLAKTQASPFAAYTSPNGMMMPRANRKHPKRRWLLAALIAACILSLLVPFIYSLAFHTHSVEAEHTQQKLATINSYAFSCYSDSDSTHLPASTQEPAGSDLYGCLIQPMTMQKTLVLTAGTYVLVRATLGTRMVNGKLIGLLPYPKDDEVLTTPSWGDNWDMLVTTVTPGTTYRTQGLGFAVYKLSFDPKNNGYVLHIGRFVVDSAIQSVMAWPHYVILKTANPLMRTIWLRLG